MTIRLSNSIRVLRSNLVVVIADGQLPDVNCVNKDNRDYWIVKDERMYRSILSVIDVSWPERNAVLFIRRGSYPLYTLRFKRQ